MAADSSRYCRKTQSVEQCSWACLLAIDYQRQSTNANRLYSCVILIHTTNLVDTGLYCTLKIPPMANTLTLLVNLLSRLSERFYIDIARVGFTLIEIYKALSVDFARTIVYSIAFIDVETKLLTPLQICLLMTLVLMII